MSNAATITRNSIWNLLDTLLSFGAALVTSVAVARVMGPTKLGYYQYVMWVATMTGTVASLGVPGATTKYAAEYLGKGDHATARTIVRVTFLFQSYVAATVAVGGLLIVWLRVGPENRTWATLAILAVVPQLLYAIPVAAITATEDMRPNVRVSVVSTTINVVAVTLTLIYGWDLEGLAGSLLLSRVVDLLLRYIYYRRMFDAMPAKGVRAPLPPDVRQRLIRFSWQSTILLLLDIVVWNRSEIFFLQRYSAITEIAFFSVGFNVVDSLMVIPRVVTHAAATTMLVQQGRAPGTVARMGVTMLRYMALFSIPAAFGLAALCDPTMRLVYGQKYLPAIPILMVTALFCVGKALQMPAQRLLQTTEKQGFMVGWGVSLAVFNILFSLVMIPRFGALGAAYTKGIVQTVAMFGMWWYAKRKLNAPIPMGSLVGLLLLSGVMFGTVQLVSHALPGSLADLIVGIPLGAAIMIVGLRLIRFLEPADRSRLAPLERVLPGPLRSTFSRVVRFVTPEPRREAGGDLVGGA